MNGTAVKITRNTCPSWCAGEHPTTGDRTHTGRAVEVTVLGDRHGTPARVCLGQVEDDEGGAGPVELWLHADGLSLAIHADDFAALTGTMEAARFTYDAA